MLEGLSKKQKKIVLISAGLFVLISAFVVIYSFANSSKNQFGDSIKIKNFDKLVKNLPKYQKDSIESKLYQVVKNNSSDGANLKISDANIRDKSASQGFNSKTKAYTGYFIVDIPSVKQSYQVNYFYPTDPSLVPPPGYVMTITCPLEQQLIYGSFNCKDESSDQISTIDPLLKYLPKSTLTYEITPTIDNNKITKLNIRLLLSGADYRTGVNNAINKYKAEALSFIRATGQDPSKYTIEYTY